MTDPHVLDPKSLERLREWGGDKLLSEMVRLFLENAPQRMEQIRRGAGDGNLDDGERGAHSLKSSAANLGAEKLRALAADAERAASDGDRDSVASMLPDLEDAFSQVITALQSVREELSR
jgi:HPt (histidine-containing phosphotransfer) domain-containing protein